MEEQIDQIEEFLRGQMSQQEELDFKAEVKSNVYLRFQAYAIVILNKNY